MPSHSEVRFSPYTPEQLYALVIDIEKYPEFLPWCKAARITERRSNHFIGELVISFNHMTESYKSKVMGNPQAHRIEVELVSGPFKNLYNHWHFEPHNGGTNIHFAVEFEFRSKILEKLIGGVFMRALEKMDTAFVTRADALYGGKPT